MDLCLFLSCDYWNRYDLWFLIFFLGFGSAFYHWHPTTQRLFWDRIFIALAMMAFFGAILCERVLNQLSSRVRTIVTVILIFFGGFATTYWHITEEQGHGDLSLYSIALWTPTALFPLVLLMYPTCYRGTRFICLAMLGFLLSRVFEALDKQIFYVLHISGHTLKHLSVSLSMLCVVLYLKYRKEIDSVYVWKLRNY